MAFWSRKASPQSASDTENSYRAIDPAAFDKGAMINDIADHLRRIASGKLRGSDVVIALQTALGAEIAALTARRNPNAEPDTFRYIMEQALEAVTPGVREAAYTAANLPAPEPYGEGDLTEDQFRELTNRIMNAATRDNVPVTDAMTATARALGIILCLVGERQGDDVERLIVFSQDAIRQFTKEAISVRQQKQ